ncbi:MAG: TRAP transporter large permease [Deltaproteobacteria bacterium]|nr:TRAP transporter large permease [Deltaproteobacteria bacterium]
MSEVVIGILGTVFMFSFLATGVEMGFAMTLVGFLGLGYLGRWDAASNQVVKDYFETFSSYGFTVIPLFVLMGQVASSSDIAKKIYASASKIVGHIPGGLAMTTVVGATFFKAMCGSSLATCATFASIACPEMARLGYSRKLSTGVVASVGTLGILLPPCVPLIIYGLITEQSIGKLFLAGILPALLIALFFMVVIYGWVKINPSIAPATQEVSRMEKIKALPDFLWVTIIFLLIIGGLMAGWFSPTEAGSMGTAAVLILAYVKTKFTFKQLIVSFEESLKTACMILTLIAGSVVFGHFLMVTQIPFITADWIGGLGLNRNLVMVIIIVIYLLGGSIMDDLAFMIIATPIFFPAIVTLGFDPIWFGIMIGITLMIGTIIPPVAVGVFVVKNITGESFKVVYSGVVPFLLSLATVAALLFVFPQIALFLPGLQ